jgi:hypothetical protein
MNPNPVPVLSSVDFEVTRLRREHSILGWHFQFGSKSSMPIDDVDFFMLGRQFNS